MLTIDNTQDLTLEDFIHNKGKAPFKPIRSVISKLINFSLLFGCSAPTFATILEQGGYTEEEAWNYIKSSGNIPMFNATLIKQQGRMDKKKVTYLVAATLMRNAFFDTYKGLQSRIEREQNFAKKNGFVRTWHGPVRHLPEMRYFNIGDKGLVGADKALYSSMYAHMLNDACNSTIQSLESRVAFSTWYESANYLKKWHLKSRIWNNIHDSLDLWIYKPELELVMSLMNACASWEREPVYGIHMSFDGEVVEEMDYVHRQDTFWKHGQELPIKPIEEAVEHWNYQHKNISGFEPIKWEGCKF